MKKLSILSGILLVARTIQGQGTMTFQNLNFEQANPVSAGAPGVVTAASALPDWTVYAGTMQQDQVFQNGLSTGEAAADIIGPRNPSGSSGEPDVIDGNYSVVLQGGYSPSAPPFTLVSTTLEQTGLIPAGDQSLEFKASAISFSVSINGNALSLVALDSTANYTLYGVDVSAYAGQIGTLAFTDPPQPDGGVGFLELDDIAFTTSAVPEPSPAILIGVGGLMFAAWRGLARRKS